MPNLLIRNVPEATIEVLKARASARGHSLQAEALDVLTSAATKGAQLVAWLKAHAIDADVDMDAVVAGIRADRDR